MDDAGVKMMPYDEFFNHLKQIKQQNILVSPNSNQSVFDTLKDAIPLLKLLFRVT